MESTNTTDRRRHEVISQEELERIRQEAREEVVNEAREREKAKAKAREEALMEAREAQRTAAEEREAVQQSYGSPGAAPGMGNQLRGPDPNSKEAAIDRVWARLKRGHGLQRPDDKMDANVAVVERLRQAIDFQHNPHPELGLGIGGSYKGEGPSDRRIVDARVEQR